MLSHFHHSNLELAIFGKGILFVYSFSGAFVNHQPDCGRIFTFTVAQNDWHVFINLNQLIYIPLKYFTGLRHTLLECLMKHVFSNVLKLGAPSNSLREKCYAYAEYLYLTACFVVAIVFPCVEVHCAWTKRSSVTDLCGLLTLASKRKCVSSTCVMGILPTYLSLYLVIMKRSLKWVTLLER